MLSGRGFGLATMVTAVGEGQKRCHLVASDPHSELGNRGVTAPHFTGENSESSEQLSALSQVRKIEAQIQTRVHVFLSLYPDLSRKDPGTDFRRLAVM